MRVGDWGRLGGMDRRGTGGRKVRKRWTIRGRDGLLRKERRTKKKREREKGHVRVPRAVRCAVTGLGMGRMGSGGCHMIEHGTKKPPRAPSLVTNTKQLDSISCTHTWFSFKSYIT